MRTWRHVLGALAALLLGEELAVAEAEEAPERTLAPYFVVSGAEGETEAFPLASTSARVRIVGVIAEVTVTQSYSNQGRTPIEATYLFPASMRAAVSAMTMTIGDRRISAHIAERGQARREYQQAKTAGKSASLLEEHRPNVFQMHVANILPGDKVQVELSYTELLLPDEGAYEFLFPTVVGPRYTNRPATGASAEHTWTRNPYLQAGSPVPYGFEIAVELAGGVPISEVRSVSHRVEVRFESPTKAAVTLDPSEQYAGDRDFVLRYRLSGQHIETGLLLEPGADESFFLLMVQPPRRITPAQIAPREYIFILDISGSMHGFPLAVAKTLMRNLLTGLREVDTFNLVLFAGGSAVLAPSSLPATPEHVARGLALVEQQAGGGGTELVPALEAALALPPAVGSARTFVLVTDGYVDVEQEAFELARTHVGDANFFTFGIGTAVNRLLIEGLARAGAGEAFIATAEDEAKEAAARFVRVVSSPLLVGASVDFGSFEVLDVEPPRPPDLYAERPVVVFGKWRGAPAGVITLKGLAGSEPWSTTVDVAVQGTTVEGRALAYLWARQRIGLLEDACALNERPETVAEIRDLGLRYGLLTKYTSFVAVDEIVRRRGSELKEVAQPLPLPQGVGDLAVGGSVPTTPEPETWLLISVVASVLGAVALRRALA